MVTGEPLEVRNHGSYSFISENHQVVYGRMYEEHVNVQFSAL